MPKSKYFMMRQIIALIGIGSVIFLLSVKLLAGITGMRHENAVMRVELAALDSRKLGNHVISPSAGIQNVIKGQLVQQGGGPAAYVLVRCDTKHVWTDARGKFELRNIPLGREKFVLDSPAYQPRTIWILVSRNEEIVTPIVMTPKDPYKPAFSGPIGPGEATWLTTSIDVPFNMNEGEAPTAKAQAKEMSFLMTPGQTQSKAVAFFANQSLTKLSTSIRFGDVNTGHKPVKVRVRWVKRTLDRLHNFNHSRVAARFAWRYLWNRPPAKIKRGDVRMLVVTIVLPATAEPGVYHGTLTLGANENIRISLPINLRILGFHLVQPKKRLGLYYSYHHYKSSWTRLELRDIRSHGGSILVDALPPPSITMEANGDVRVDMARVRATITLLRQYGFTPPYMVPLPVDRMYNLAQTRLREVSGKRFGKKNGNFEYIAKSKPFMRIDCAVISALNKLQRSLKTGPLIIYWMDEIFDHHRLPKWLAMAKATRPLTNDPIYVTLYTGYRTEKMMDEVSPYVNIRCYHGGMIDWWLANTTKELAKTNWPVPRARNWWRVACGHTFAELANDLHRNHATAWVYYNQMDIQYRPPECERIINGYWLWMSPFTASVPWCYRIFGNRFSAMASRSLNFGFVFHDPKAHKLVGTLGWEAYRQGYNDLSYLATLQKAIRQAPAGSRAVRAAQHWLEQIRTSRPETATGMAIRLSPRNLTERRVQMARMIEALIRKP